MKIGYDVSQTGKYKAGCGYMAESLISSLVKIDQKNEFILYPQFGSDFWDPDAVKKTFTIFQSNVSKKIIGSNFHECALFWNSFSRNGEKFLGNPDIIHSNNFFCPIGVTKAKIVYTLHDIGFLEYPELTTEQNRWICFNGVFNASNNANFIISVSKYSREKFLEFFPHFPPEKIKVTYLGSRFDSETDLDFGYATLFDLTPGRFWLTACTLEPRKNLRRLLKAFSDFQKEKRMDIPLVLAGGKGWMEDDLDEFIHDLNLTDDVKVTGYVSDNELIWLYKNCFAFVFPSVYEGFGLPVLEAMSMGAPVIASRTSSIPEVAGDAAHYIDPYRREDMAAAFYRMANDNEYRLDLKSKAAAQAKKFSWKKCATEVLEVYRRAMES